MKPNKSGDPHSNVIYIDGAQRYIGKPGSGGGGSDMEARVAKLEASITHIEQDISDIKTDIRDLRQDVREVRRDMQTDFRLLFGALIAVALGLAGLMARGFGWL